MNFGRVSLPLYRFYQKALVYSSQSPSLLHLHKDSSILSLLRKSSGSSFSSFVTVEPLSSAASKAKRRLSVLRLFSSRNSIPPPPIAVSLQSNKKPTLKKGRATKTIMAESSNDSRKFGEEEAETPHSVPHSSSPHLSSASAVSTISHQMGHITTTGNFRVLTINDVYNIEPINSLGGYAELATLLRRYRTQNSIFTLNGDFLGGNPTAQRFKGLNVIQMLNTLDVDYVVLGNHEFDHGDQELKKCIAESNFKWLGSNVFEKSSGKIFEGIIYTDTITLRFKRGSTQDLSPVIDPSSGSLSSDSFSCSSEKKNKKNKKSAEFPPTSMDDAEEVNLSPLGSKSDFETVKIGIFGVCTQKTPVLSFPSENVEFKNVIDESRKAVARLKEEDKVDLIIGITHVSLEEDKKIASKIRGIFALLGGHDHVPLLHIEDKTWIMKTGQNAYHLGVVDLKFVITRSLTKSNANQRYLTVFPSFSFVPNTGCPPDLQCKSVIDEYSSIILKEAKEKGLEKIVLTVDSESIRDLETLTDVVRRKQCEFTSYMADSLKYHFEKNGKICDFAIINGGTVRGDRTYPPGSKLSLYDLQQELPFIMQINLIQIKGTHIREAIEQELRGAPKPVGSFPHPSEGVCIIFDANGEPLSKIKSIEIDGVPLDPDREYNVAITNFMESGGDGCSSFTYGKRVAEGKDLFSIVAEYFSTLPPIDPQPFNRIVEVEEMV